MSQVQISLFTKQKRFQCSDAPLSVLGSVTEAQLNELLKRLLIDDAEDTDAEEQLQTINFDFLLDGQILRCPLIQLCKEKEVSLETVIALEYIPQQAAPIAGKSFNHDDWVSGVKLHDGMLLSGCYDCSVHVWSLKDGQKIVSAVRHVEPIKSVCFYNNNQNKDDNQSHFISTSQDQHMIIWDLNTTEGKVRPAVCCKGHSKSVECVAVRKDNNVIASGGWDSAVKVWSASPVADESDKQFYDPESISKKKRQKVEQKGIPRAARHSFLNHTEAVTGVVWMSNNELSSCSWDHTIRFWDLNQQVETSQLQGSKAHLSVDYSPLNKCIITGSSDRHIRIWDPRDTGGKLVKQNLSSHVGWVTCVKWSPNNEHQCVSGSLDNHVKLWDIRSPTQALYDFEAHQDKVMCLDWLGNKVASGGADCKVFTYSTETGTIDSDDVTMT